jgi:tRNA(adenine34) deaminase
MNTTDQKWMEIAITEAKRAASIGEVPIGALLVKENLLLASSCNSPISQCDPTAHAEISVIRSASELMQNYRLPGTTLYVTLEPCIMCIGAIIHARIDRLVFGAYDQKTGTTISKLRSDVFNELNHKVDFSGGVLEKECSDILRDFFSKKRRIKRKKH